MSRGTICFWMILIKIFARTNDLFGVLISESFGIRTFLTISAKIYFAEDEIMEYIHDNGKFFYLSIGGFCNGFCAHYPSLLSLCVTH